MPADEMRSGGNAVIVLSHKGWDRHFNRDPNVLGRTVLVNGAPFEIIGVTPMDSAGSGGGPDLWAPSSLWGSSGRPIAAAKSAGVEIVGRLRPGVSKEQARATGGLGFDNVRRTRRAAPRALTWYPRNHPAAAGSRRGLRTALRRLRIDH